MDCIPDPIVAHIDEAIAAIREAGYEVVVVSTRCKADIGHLAIMDYLNRNGIKVDKVMAEKPPAVCYIDDRAICFDGKAGELLHRIETFKPWYLW